MLPSGSFDVCSQEGLEKFVGKEEIFMGKVKLAIAGVGNCASSLVQGITYYSNGHGHGHGHGNGNVFVRACRRMTSGDAELCAMQFSVEPAFGDELVMAADLDDTALVEDADEVGPPHR